MKKIGLYLSVGSQSGGSFQYCLSVLKYLQSLNSKLPENIRSTQIKSNESYLMVEIEPIKKIINIAENLPGFNKELIIKKIPRILKEKDTRKMGIKIAKGIKIYGYKGTDLAEFNLKNIELLFQKNLLENNLIKPVYLS